LRCFGVSGGPTPVLDLEAVHGQVFEMATEKITKTDTTRVDAVRRTISVTV